MIERVKLTVKVKGIEGLYTVIDQIKRAICESDYFTIMPNSEVRQNLANKMLEKWECTLERKQQTVDPREPDPSRFGLFILHNCQRCLNGRRLCVRGNPTNCEYLHARND